ncbi:lysozyme [Enterobacter mori]|uniref:lysozyme n=1 Tax=Enterobacter mori TaxID=539813 RepID=UPI0021B0F3DC|nr:lysozyme [Enterobacter mori]UWX93147.1 lysozyme [Enterobacter mori]
MKGSTLKISSAAITLIKKNQGLSLEKYRDENGLWVIGYGHTIRQWEAFPRLITPDEAEYLLHDDLKLCETLLRENMTQLLTQQQHDALVLMIFSFGEIPTLVKALLQAVERV